MNVSVLLGHPYEQSFNAAIAVAVVRTLEENGHTVRFHDLHGEGFDPVISGKELISDMTGDELLAAHQREIREADGIIQYATGAGRKRLRRSSGTYLEGLYI